MEIIFISIIAGVVGTGLGGFITSLFTFNDNKIISSLLAFAGGVMASIVFFEIIPEAINHANFTITIVGTVVGIIAVMLINNYIDKRSNKQKSNSALHESFAEFYHKGALTPKQKNLFNVGILMFLSIAFHGLPEGLIIGAAGAHNIALSITIAIMLGLHNIPEGMAVAAPLISGGLSKPKAVILSILAGCPAVFGALIGLFLGNLSNLALALSFSISGGAMLYVVFGELLPQSSYLSKDRIPTIVLLFGILLGLFITEIL